VAVLRLGLVDPDPLLFKELGRETSQPDPTNVEYHRASHFLLARPTHIVATTATRSQTVIQHTACLHQIQKMFLHLPGKFARCAQSYRSSHSAELTIKLLLDRLSPESS
jgi:hypothetical protein